MWSNLIKKYDYNWLWLNWIDYNWIENDWIDYNWKYDYDYNGQDDYHSFLTSSDCVCLQLQANRSVNVLHKTTEKEGIDKSTVRNYVIKYQKLQLNGLIISDEQISGERMNN